MTDFIHYTKCEKKGRFKYPKNMLPKYGAVINIKVNKKKKIKSIKKSDYVINDNIVQVRFISKGDTADRKERGKNGDV